MEELINPLKTDLQIFKVKPEDEKNLATKIKKKIGIKELTSPMKGKQNGR
jgi:hypothetical protein